MNPTNRRAETATKGKMTRESPPPHTDRKVCRDKSKASSKAYKYACMHNKLANGYSIPTAPKTDMELMLMLAGHT